MTKVVSSKSISSARANPMGNRPTNPPTSPTNPAHQAVDEIAKNYGDMDNTEDHQMSPGVTHQKCLVARTWIIDEPITPKYSAGRSPFIHSLSKRSSLAIFVLLQHAGIYDVND
ncbi:hypothetical protein BV22DRAFT_1052045 [Leucogyrophana mollusca]|uniref:Uncharacterized protein n=1 Tax=Leucogyrophana mollusca TaxID=85980 RepID=A0ACB8AXG8_9AGAM|nr:hypothetical protein BV22DRAFT_1052045 [Leucogyrophana mollusca]